MGFYKVLNRSFVFLGNMVQVKKPILENPIYCDILIKIGDKKVSGSEFIEKFRDWDSVGESYTMDRSLLARYLKELSDKKNQYLKVDPKSRKYNKKIYFLNRKKITREFIGCLIEFMKEAENTEYAEELNKKREDYGLNPFVQDFVVYLLKSLDDGRSGKISLKEFFREFFTYLARVDERKKEAYDVVLAHLGLGDIIFKGKVILDKEIKKLFGKRFDEFKEFEDFLHDLNVVTLNTDSYYDEKIIRTGQSIADKYLGEDEGKRITDAILTNMISDTKDDYKPFYPREKEDFDRIKKSEVEQIVKTLRELRRKDYEEKDINNKLISLLKELKTKFYFLDVPPGRINIEDLKKYKHDKNDVQVLIAEIVFFEAELCNRWNIKFSDEDLEDMEIVYRASRLYISKDEYVKRFGNKA